MSIQGKRRKLALLLGAALLVLSGCRVPEWMRTQAPQRETGSQPAQASPRPSASPGPMPGASPSPSPIPSPTVTSEPFETPEPPATSSGKALVYVSGYDSKIRVHSLDLATGELMAKGTVTTPGASPSYIAVHPDHQKLYAVNEAYNGGNGGKVSSYALNLSTGALAPLGSFVNSGGDGPAHVSVHPSGKWLLVSHYGNGYAAVLPIGSTGAASSYSTRRRDVTEKAHQMISDPTGQFVFVPSTGPNRILQYAFDVFAGTLLVNAPPSVAGASGAQPRHLAWHPSLAVAYVANEADSTVTSYSYDSSAGTLGSPQSLSMLPSGYSGANTAAHVAVRPDGRYVYASNRGHNSIAIFAADSSTGRLSLAGIETASGRLRTTRHFAIDPSGQYLVAANQDGNSVLVFHIDAQTGMLTQVGPPLSAPSPTCVVIVPQQ